MELLKYIFLLALWNSILFYGKSLGLSVILFILPLLILIYYSLNKNNKIKNKKGLLLMIPIILLSSTYFIFNTIFFRVLNCIVIPILIVLLYVFTMRINFTIPDVIEDFFTILFKPFSCINKIINLLLKDISNKVKLSNNSKKTLKSILIISPIVLIILLLLSSADMIFEDILINTIDFSFIKNIFTKDFINSIFWRTTLILLLFIYIGSTISFLLFNYEEQEDIKEKNTKKRDNYTIKVLLTVLNIIYLIFDCIQIKSLLMHSVSNSINYAEYARQGFFQLMFVSIINITLLLISKKYEDKEKKNNKYTNIMSLIMVVLTFMIIISSFLRMNLYESQYGYTLLRLLVYVVLITEAILLIPTIIYIFNSKFKITKYYFIIIISVYTIFNFVNIDKIIALRNIDRYYKIKDIDIEYLENYNTDNISELIKFYKKVDDKEIKKELEDYFNSIETTIDGFQEFNISKCVSEKEIKKLNLITIKKGNNK